MDVLEDIELIKRFKNGDESAFNELVKKYMNRAYNIAYSIVYNSEDAKDMSQEAFVKVYNSINQFRGDSAFYTWFYRILVNICLTYKRRNTKTLSITTEDGNIRAIKDNSPGPVEKFEGSIIKEKIKEVLSKLSDKQKIVFELKNYENLSLKEISEILKMNIGTVKTHLFRAVKNLKDNISPYLEDSI